MRCIPSARRKGSVRGHIRVLGVLCALACACSIDLLVLGAAGIYRGYMATLYSFGPFSAFYFGFYEQSKSAAVRLASRRRAHQHVELL